MDRTPGRPVFLRSLNHRLVGLALWESQDAFEASASSIFQAVAGDPFDKWCQNPPDVFHLTEPER